MYARHRLLTPPFCAVIILVLIIGCAVSTPGTIEVSPTVAATAAPAQATMAPQPTPQVVPTTSVPPTPTSEPSTHVPPSPAPLPPPTIPPVGPPYEDRGDPVSLLASYFNAVNRKEYPRAWAYWENPPNPSYEDFVQGYAETAHVLLAVRPPTFIEGAAGSQYTSFPTLLIMTHTDNSQHNFVGCYVARRANPNIEGAPADGWSLFDATVSATPGNSSDALLLSEACETRPETQYDDRASPVRLLASYFNAVSRKEYPRAWAYWENPPNPSYEDFVQGYAETTSVLLVVRPPTFIEGAAGSQYTSIPTLLIVTHTDDSQHNFVGCYVARRANPHIEGAPPDGWSLFDATISVTGSTDAAQLAQACATP